MLFRYIMVFFSRLDSINETIIKIRIPDLDLGIYRGHVNGEIILVN